MNKVNIMTAEQTALLVNDNDVIGDLCPAVVPKH